MSCIDKRHPLEAVSESRLIEDATLGVEELDGIFLSLRLLAKCFLNLVARLAGLLDLLFNGRFKVLLRFLDSLLRERLSVIDDRLRCRGGVGSRVWLVRVFNLASGLFLVLLFPEVPLNGFLAVDRVVERALRRGPSRNPRLG